MVSPMRWHITSPIAMKDLYFPNVTLNSTDNVGCDFKNITAQDKHIADVVQEKVSQWSIYYTVARGITCLVATSLYGSLSDRYGRKRLLFLSLMGVCIESGLRFSFTISYLILAAAFYALKFACVPILRSTMSILTPEDKQDSIFGAIAVFENICSMCGSAMAGAVYSATVPIYKGFVFFVMAGFNVVATVLIT
ncbi:hypothetical protein FSP39_004409 [Pinctada imbricata]|uniref:Major facilitator superfamily (MFS) profile domain-containing protein n=1 Tax=Pinctada imbricata TaxID=66713 RepID=A0AA89C4U4_PINIB|nr:hypothetical protein FSP39_004409 [Pinctada imbricata]